MRIYYLLFTLAILLSGCSSDLVESLTETKPTTQKRNIALTLDHSTRISMGEKSSQGTYPLYWQQGDKIVINGVGVSDPLDPLFDGEKSAIFTTDLQVEYPLTIIYPGDVLLSPGSILIPAEQSYMQSKLANGFGILIGHTVDEQDPLEVKHACGYIKVPVTGSQPISKVILSTIDGEALTGTFDYVGDKFTLNAVRANKHLLNEADYAKMAQSSTFITINTDTQLSETATDFYFALPAGRYNGGFTVTVVGADGMSTTKSMYTAEGKDIEAGVMTIMPTFTYSADKPIGIYTTGDYIAFALTTSFWAWSDTNNIINLYADLDFSHYQNVPAASLDNGYIFNGNNHTISGLKAESKEKYSALLFSYLGATSKIKNLTLGKVAGKEADCSLTVTTTEAGSNATFNSPFCTVAWGDIENCKNYATLNLNLGGASLAVNAGGITSGVPNDSKAVGDLVKCINYGDINLTDGTSTSMGTTRIGGIVGRTAFNRLTECENYGTISSIVTIKSGHQQVGGIAGVGVGPSGDNKVIPTGCINHGTIYFEHSGTRSGNGCVGGIFGAIPCDIVNCHNKGTLTLLSPNAEGKCYMGGIVGWWSANNGYTIDQCTNRAQITIGTKYSAAVNTIAGIAGYASAEGKGELGNCITNSTNHGNIIASDTGLIRLGGISGSSCRQSNNTNYGNITFQSSTSTATSYIGGISGVIAYDYTNTHNYGDITSNATNVYLGGIAGWTTNHLTTLAGCCVDCTVSGNIGYAGLAIGNIKYAEVIGTESAPCKFAGAVVRSGTTTNISQQQDIKATNLFGTATKTPVLTYALYEATKPTTIE